MQNLAQAGTMQTNPSVATTIFVKPVHVNFGAVFGPSLCWNLIFKTGRRFDFFPDRCRRDLNNPINTVNSVGGDFELSELLGYAGDSRLNAAGTSFLDGIGEGLEPPKMAVEFDTRTNNDTLAYCSSASTADTDTRNDPFANNRDAVQFVYWGGKKLDIPCRDDSPTYDDNRHGCPTFPNWNFTTGDDVKSSPAIGADCTIYFGSNDNKVYALNPDGTAQTGIVALRYRR